LSKKVAILGNMNNVPAVTARALIYKGYDVTLFFLSEYEHFKPESDSHAIIENLKMINLGWERDDIIKLTKQQIKDKIGGFDFYLGVEWAPALTWKAGIKLDMFYAIGTDLTNYPFYKINRFPPPVWLLKLHLLAKQQFYAIKYATYLSMNKAPEVMEKQRKIINPKGKRIVGIPYLYTPQYTQAYLNKSKYKQEFDEIREQFDFVVFHHIRHEWVISRNTIHDKGNDILFNALKEIKIKHPEKKIVVITIDYGTDVDQSKVLINDLEISNSVKWFPKMEKKHLLYGLKSSDVFVGQLADSFPAYTSVYEALAMGKTIIHKGDEKDKSLYPIINAFDTESLSTALDKCITGEISTIEMGQKGYVWFQQNGFDLPVNEVIRAIESNAKPFNSFWGKIHCEAIKLAIIILTPIEKIVFKIIRLKKAV
jgi:glycosyltransferase involved in cell wall biosynthesis